MSRFRVLVAHARRAALPLAGLLSSGCVVVPATIDTYDPGCQVVAHHMVLQSVQIAEVDHCRNQECTMMVVAAAATVTVTAIVSGSVMIVGNAAYWIERRANCRPAEAPAPDAPDAPRPPAPPG